MWIVFNQIINDLKQLNFVAVLSFILLIFVFTGQAVDAKKMYRWVDEDGKVFFSDQVPPDQVKHRRESLNENVRVIKVVDKEKTKAQLKLDKRLAMLRKQKDEIIAKQKASDNVLLSTYRSIDDMKLSLNSKVSSFDGQKKVMEGNLKRLELQLLQQQKKAAQFERDGRKVPGNLLTNIIESKKQIELAQIEISKQIDKKEYFIKKFEGDIARFDFLSQPQKNIKEIKIVDNAAENELGLFVCQTVEQCQYAWKSAKQFVNIHSTSPLDIETDKLIMSQGPFKESDLSLSVSKLELDDHKQQLFLDIHCRQSAVGNDLCKGFKVEKIRQSFSDYIRSALILGM